MDESPSGEAPRNDGKKSSALKTTAQVLGILVLLFFAIPLIGRMFGLDSKPSKYDFRRSIESTLKDADSARFQDERMHKLADGSVFLCGEVNAKNGFGAYTGFKRYVASTALSLIDDDSAEFAQLWEKSCYGPSP